MGLAQGRELEQALVPGLELEQVDSFQSLEEVERRCVERRSLDLLRWGSRDRRLGRSFLLGNPLIE